MPAFAHVLEKFASKLTERGSQSAQRSVAVLASGMSFLSNIGHPTEDDVAVAGYIVALFKLPDAIALCRKPRDTRHADFPPVQAALAMRLPW